VTIIAANKTMPTITPINMGKFIHDEDELGSLVSVPEGI
jgi:hypothetical protein